jgi:hypothetical protein
MERETGIEPALVAWKATVLPLNYSRAGRTCLGVAPMAGEAFGTCFAPDVDLSVALLDLVEGGGFEPPKA